MKIKQLIYLLGAFMVLFTVSCNTSNEQKKRTAAPLVDSSIPPEQIFQTTEVDLGELIDGEKVECSYLFKNTGGQNLYIANVETSCGCTATDFSTEAIAPGESGTIDVIFDSDGFRGLQIKKITVISNASNSPVELTLASLVTRINE